MLCVAVVWAGCCWQFISRHSSGRCECVCCSHGCSHSHNHACMRDLLIKQWNVSMGMWTTGKPQLTWHQLGRLQLQFSNYWDNCEISARPISIIAWYILDIGARPISIILKFAPQVTILFMVKRNSLLCKKMPLRLPLDIM